MRTRRFRWPALGSSSTPDGHGADQADPVPGPGGVDETPPLPPAEMPVAPAVVPRWVQAVLLPLALLALWELARSAGPVLLILVFASVIALILNPIAKLFERFLPRGMSIVAVYVAMFAVLSVGGILLANPISSQVNHFSKNVPHLVNQANHQLDNIQRFLKQHGIRIAIKQGQTALQTLQKKVLKSSGSIVSFSRDLLGKLVTFGVDVVLTFVLSIYLLVYARDIGNLVRRIMPPGSGSHEDDYPLLVQRAVSGYVRGQLLFSVIMGTSAGLGLWLFGIVHLFPDGSRYAVFFGAFYGIAEFVPYIGPIIGPVPAVLVALFTSPISAVWVLILFVGLQQLEGHVVAPQVFRISLRINPIIVILSLLIGYHIYGVAGALLALPVATITRQTIIYLRRHLVLEPWTRAVPQPPPPPPPPAPLDFERDEVSVYREER
jgi:predicted PurR-regulated permease PerM